MHQIVTALLHAGADPNTVITQSRSRFASPLEYACRSGCLLDTVELLLDHGAKPIKRNIGKNAEDEDDNDDEDDDASLYRRSPPIAQMFLNACSKGHLRLVRLLLDASKDTLLTVGGRDWVHGVYQTALHIAVRNIDIRSGEEEGIDLVRELIRRGADLCARDQSLDVQTPLDVRSRSNSNSPDQRRATALILEAYAERIWQQHGDQSLHFCLRKMGTLVQGRVRLPVGDLDRDQVLDLFRFFVQRDANCLRAPSADDEREELPIHVAIRRVAPMFVIEFLAEQGPASLRVADGATGSLPIHAACGGRGITREEIQLLVDLGGVEETLAKRDHAGAMPLHRMVESLQCGRSLQSGTAPSSALSSVKFVLAMYPAAVLAKTRQGHFPFMLAAMIRTGTHSSSDMLSVVYELVRAGPQVVVGDASKGQTKKDPSTPRS